MSHKPGDRIRVFIPGGVLKTPDIREGIVKSVGGVTGRTHWYCVDSCGECGPKTGDGSHRLGILGTRIV